MEKEKEEKRTGEIIGYEEVSRILSGKILLVVDPGDPGNVRVIKVQSWPREQLSALLCASPEKLQSMAPLEIHAHKHMTQNPHEMTLVVAKFLNGLSEEYPKDRLKDIDDCIDILKIAKKRFSEIEARELKELASSGLPLSPELEKKYPGGVPRSSLEADMQTLQGYIDEGLGLTYIEFKRTHNKRATLHRKDKDKHPHPGPVIPEYPEYLNVRRYIALKRSIDRRLKKHSIVPPIFVIDSVPVEGPPPIFVGGPPQIIVIDSVPIEGPPPIIAIDIVPTDMLCVLTMKEYEELRYMTDYILEHFSDIINLAKLREYHRRLGSPMATVSERDLRYQIENRFEEDGRYTLGS